MTAATGAVAPVAGDDCATATPDGSSASGKDGVVDAEDEEDVDDDEGADDSLDVRDEMVEDSDDKVVVVDVAVVVDVDAGVGAGSKGGPAPELAVLAALSPAVVAAGVDEMLRRGVTVDDAAEDEEDDAAPVRAVLLVPNVVLNDSSSLADPAPFLVDRVPNMMDYDW
jgi:hypothetical protein